MNLFATPADYEAWTQSEAPDGIGRLLTLASSWVRDAVKRASFPVDRDGNPTDETVAAALRDATCEQAYVWHTNGIEPGKTQERGPVASSSIGDASITYETSSVSAERALLASALAPSALAILDGNDLVWGQPWAR